MATKKTYLVGTRFIHTKSGKKVIALDFDAESNRVLVQDDTHVFWTDINLLKLIESVNFIIKAVKWIISLFKK